MLIGLFSFKTLRIVIFLLFNFTCLFHFFFYSDRILRVRVTIKLQTKIMIFIYFNVYGQIGFIFFSVIKTFFFFVTTLFNSLNILLLIIHFMTTIRFQKSSTTSQDVKQIIQQTNESCNSPIAWCKMSVRLILYKFKYT